MTRIRWVLRLGPSTFSNQRERDLCHVSLCNSCQMCHYVWLSLIRIAKKRKAASKRAVASPWVPFTVSLSVSSVYKSMSYCFRASLPSNKIGQPCAMAIRWRPPVAAAIAVAPSVVVEIFFEWQFAGTYLPQIGLHLSIDVGSFLLLLLQHLSPLCDRYHVSMIRW